MRSPVLPKSHAVMQWCWISFCCILQEIFGAGNFFNGNPLGVSPSSHCWATWTCLISIGHKGVYTRMHIPSVKYFNRIGTPKSYFSVRFFPWQSFFPFQWTHIISLWFCLWNKWSKHRPPQICCKYRGKVPDNSSVLGNGDVHWVWTKIATTG